MPEPLLPSSKPFDITALPCYDFTARYSQYPRLLFVLLPLDKSAERWQPDCFRKCPFRCRSHLISTYISTGTTDTAIFPPAEVYFTALSSRLKRASDVHLLSWETVKSSGQIHGHGISFFSAAYTIPLMACATVSKRRPISLSNWITPVSRREVFTRA